MKRLQMGKGCGISRVLLFQIWRKRVGYEDMRDSFQARRIVRGWRKGLWECCRV